MSEENETVTTPSCCASCGIAGGDDVKLKNCNGCYLVKYCGVDCQKAHRKQHKRACKKRAAELRDELLFKQPESSCYGDCPICCLPLPIDITKSTLNVCCSKVICNGCNITNKKRESEMRLQLSCPFCREPLPKTQEERDKQNMKRIEANDPVAMREKGTQQYERGNYSEAFTYWKRAAELGDAVAHYHLSHLYHFEQGVEKDTRKEVYHLEEASIGGHPDARYNLGCDEWGNNNNTERALKHWIVSATQGDDRSISSLMKCFKEGFVEKDDLAVALRAHKAAVDATKSPQRQEAEKFHRD